MKPFNLEAALKGAKVVTRSGAAVTQVVEFDMPQRRRVAFVVNGNVFWANDDGTVHNKGIPQPLDLFMYASKKKKARIIIEWEE